MRAVGTVPGSPHGNLILLGLVPCERFVARMASSQQLHTFGVDCLPAQAARELNARRAQRRAPHDTLQVGKHLGDIQNALPMRLVCQEWRDTITLGVPEADLDLEPGVGSSCDSDSAMGDGTAEDAAAAQARRDAFFKRCPSITTLTYHVSPHVSLAKVRQMLCFCWFNAWVQFLGEVQGGALWHADAAHPTARHRCGLQESPQQCKIVCEYQRP